MLTLMLLRHAKATPSQGEDFARPLTDPGRTDAIGLGGWLRQAGLVPDLAIISSAKRTRQTFDAAVRGAGFTAPARFEDALFSATPDGLGDILRRVEGGFERILIVGHNPAIAELALSMAGNGDNLAIDRMRDRFPPCSLAVLTFEADRWPDVRVGAGRLRFFVTPDDLAGR